MHNLETFNTIGLSLELLHLQTGTSFELPPNFSVITVGKPNSQTPPDIDVSGLPNADVVSRTHVQIRLEGSNYLITDQGSSNGTFLNNTKLEALTSYPLNIGDKIDLGQGSQVTFIFQYKQQPQNNEIVTANPTRLQPQVLENTSQVAVDRNTKLIGMVLMVAAIVILTANVQVGIFVRIPGVLLCMAGVFLLFQRRFNHNLGWLAIALGIGVIIFTGNVFASVNLLVIIAVTALFIAGYQLFNYGNIFGYDLPSIKALFKK
jgi:hypothetical protein